MRRLRAPGRRGLPWKKLVLLGVPSAALVVLAVCGVAYARTEVPEPSRFSQEQSTVIRYAGGEELAQLGTNRVLLPLAQISEPAQKAVLAAEDRRFYTEPGISPRGILRALVTNVRGGGSVQQGGSTITQQYAKNAFLTSERTYTRKVKEVFIALKMTRQTSKEDILEDYLNTIYFGRGAYGIEAASKAYFGPAASAATLTPEQGAVLAAGIRSPAGYDPAKHPERARERWAYVLDGMAQEGWITPEQRAAAVYPEVTPTAISTSADLSGPAGHVVAQVQAELAARGFGEDELSAGGLTVTTTLRKPAQDAAVAAVEARTEGDRGDQALLGALVSVEPGTGRVVAYYGGANGGGLDYAGGITWPTDRRPVLNQPGSSFKPYVLAEALRQGVSLTTTLDGGDDRRFRGRPSPVNNFGDSDYGQVDLVRSTANSINTAYYDLGLRVGPQRVAELAHAAGVSDRVLLGDPGTGTPTGEIALGAYEVRVTDQAAGFATFAARGQAATPYLVETVEQEGEVTYAARPAARTAFSPEVAADATVAMQAVVQSGSGTRARLAGGRPAAGKTGTSSENRDLWFVGYTPQLSTAVWVGYGDNRQVELGRSEATGGTVGTGIWKAYTDAALAGQPEERFPPRANVGRRVSTGGQRSATPSRTRSATPRSTPAPTRSSSAPPSPAPTAPAPTTPDEQPSPTRSATPRPSATPTPTATPTTGGPRTPTPTRSAPAAPAGAAR